MVKKPEQLEAIVYNSKEDNCFIAHCVECDQFGTGDNKEQAIKDLGVGLKNFYNLCKKDEEKGEKTDFYFDAPEKIQQALQKAESNPNKYKPIVHEVPEYFNINIYDFTEEDFSVD